MHPRERRSRLVGKHSGAPVMNLAKPVSREKGINSTPSPALNGSLPFLPHHHTWRWEELVLSFLASMETRITASHFAETASCGHPGPSPRCPPITHRSSRSRYAMAKGDKDLMPSTGSMIPSHTVKSKVSKSQAHAQGHQRRDQSILLCLLPFSPSVRLAKPACPKAHMMVRHFAGRLWWDLRSSRN